MVHLSNNVCERCPFEQRVSFGDLEASHGSRLRSNRHDARFISILTELSDLIGLIKKIFKRVGFNN